MIGEVVNNYKISKVLGEGGMAIVYLGVHELLDTKVAIKFLRTEFVQNQNIRKRFLSEAKNMAKMSHPNVIKVSDIIDAGDIVAFVMEYIEGNSLKEHISANPNIKDEEIKELMNQMLASLSYVHSKKLVHRDIKPSNFMLTKDKIVKLTDFGIAKNTDASSADYTQTGTSQQMGTPIYMSPEQIKSTKAVDHRSDIYSMGVVLWQMITKKKPYNVNNNSSFEIQRKIVDDSLSKTNTIWDKIIVKATQKDLIKRYKNCEEFKNDIHLLFEQKKSQLDSNESVSNNPPKNYFKLALVLGIFSFVLLFLFLNEYLNNDATGKVQNNQQVNQELHGDVPSESSDSTLISSNVNSSDLESLKLENNKLKNDLKIIQGKLSSLNTNNNTDEISEKYVKHIKPILYWGGTQDGGRASRTNPSINIAYADNVPFSKSKGKFKCVTYEITIAGMKGSLKGKGGKIQGKHLKILRGAPPGSKVAISCRYSGTFDGRVTSMFTI